MSNIHAARERAYYRQDGHCYYCRHPTWLASPDAFARTHAMSLRCAQLYRATAEHLRPRQDGGRGGDNIVVACWLCNHRRHARTGLSPTPEAYQHRIAQRVSAGGWWPSGCTVLASKRSLHKN